jgi:protein SCO1/2
MRYKRIFYSIFPVLGLLGGLMMSSCGGPGSGDLPYLGNHNTVDGQTVYHQIRPFSFVNQDSAVVTNATFAGKIYVADFFFTSCPTICPKVKKNMLRIYEKYADRPELNFLSHSIDVKYDTVGRLKAYADNLNISSDRWHLITGDKDEIYKIAEDYMSVAMEDADAPGGYNHSGWIVLIDDKGHVRSYSDGTDAAAVDEFMLDIEWLLQDVYGAAKQ